MKISRFWVLFSVLAKALLLLSFSMNGTNSSIADMVFTHHRADMTMVAATSRKLKENGYHPITNEKHNLGKVNLDDYRPIDPVPSSKASVRPGPIEHGSPLIPYIPQPSPPPGQQKNGGST